MKEGSGRIQDWRQPDPMIRKSIRVAAFRQHFNEFAVILFFIFHGAGRRHQS